jgi:NAD(P)-dependent dehydrogenase (short-subunit alcohol dehydrogenase family)
VRVRTITLPAMSELERTALVTGGAGGLGRAVVAALLADGWRVVVPVEVAGELDVRPGLVTEVADLTDPGQVARIVATATAEPAAPLRAAVNLVGGFAADQPVADTPLAEFERMFTLNLRPTYLVTQAVLPHLIAAGGGGIVCVGSRAAIEPFAGAAGYAASKAAVIAFARTVAAEGRPDGVRANAIVPSLIDTPANRASMPESDYHKLVAPERIAGVVRFLCSDDSAAVTGAAINL